MRQLSSADWTMVSLDTATAHNTIGIVGIYDPSTRGESRGPVTYEEVLKYLEARLHVAESFRERLVHVPFELDRPWWIRDGDFDLEYHVRHIALPSPGSWRQLCTQIARIHARPLDLTKPPWELYLIDGLDGVDQLPPGAFAVFLRVHHAAIDGVAGAEILTAIHSQDPDDSAPPPVPEGYEWEPDAIPSDLDLLGRAALHGVTRPVDVLRQIGKMVPQLPELVADTRDPALTSPASLPKATRFNQVVSPHRVFGTAYTTLDVLKEIRAAVPHATINDVGVAVVGGAIRCYLLDKDELPDEAMVAMMPISIRPTATRAGGTAGSSTSTQTSGNEYSVAPITMATDEEDPLERLARIVTSTAHVKESGAHPVRTLIAMSEEAFGGLMGTVQRAAVRALSRRGRTVAAHTLVSNVPGPQTPMYFCGAQMVDTTGLGPVLDGMGLNNGIGSYGNRVTFCFTADRKAIPDPEVYEQCLSGAVEELLEAARARTKPTRSRRKKSPSQRARS